MKRLLAAACLAVLAVPATAHAHTETELAEWKADWEARVADADLSTRLIAEYVDWHERHPCSEALGNVCPASTPTHGTVTTATLTTAGNRTFIPAVEAWRGLVEAYFGANTDRALAVMQCESLGDAHAENPRSTASGLFQFLRGTWLRTMPHDSWPGGVFDGSMNIEAASILSKGGTDWSHWVCKP